MACAPDFVGGDCRCNMLMEMGMAERIDERRETGHRNHTDLVEERLTGTVKLLHGAGIVRRRVHSINMVVQHGWLALVGQSQLNADGGEEWRAESGRGTL